MIARRLATVVLTLGLAAPVLAASRFVTPGLTPPANGSLMCRVTNPTDAPVEFATEIYDFDGVLVMQDASYVLGPKHANGIGTQDDTARYCVVTLLAGSKRNVR